MKKILASLMMVVLVSVGAFGATRAYFTDTETLSNDFTAGKLAVELRGDYSAGIVIPVEATQAFKGGMAPGVEFGPYAVQVYNKGWGQSTIPVKYAWTSKYVDGSALYDMIDVKVREGNCDWLGQAWFTGGFLYQGKLKDMHNYVATQMGPLNPNITRCTWFYFTLDPLANNTLQGANTTFDLVLNATQVGNSGWNEDGSL